MVIISLLSDEKESKFNFYTYNKDKAEDFIKTNFRLLIGKCFYGKDKNLILAKHHTDKTLDSILNNFKEYKFDN